MKIIVLRFCNTMKCFFKTKDDRSGNKYLPIDTKNIIVFITFSFFFKSSLKQRNGNALQRNVKRINGIFPAPTKNFAEKNVGTT